MKESRIGLFSIVLLILWTAGLAISSPAGRGEMGVENTLYDRLLKQYVNQGVVDYRGIKNEEAILDQYLKVLENTDAKKLSRNEQFAFYVNAYNAWTIKLILSAYPGLKSIKELGSLLSTPWKKKIARIDGDVLTLDAIEHDLLRKQFKDPRVHFAVNCASQGCPPLRPEPYQGNILDRQLEEMTAAFLNDPSRNYLDGNTLYVNSIFKWFAEDFNNDIVGYFVKYAREDLKKRLEANGGKIKIKYLDYDWSLNGR
jgi:hypothetical protein